MGEEVNPFAQYRNKSIVPLMDSSNTTMQNEDDNPYSKFRNRNILSSTKIEEVDVEPVVQNMEVGVYSANDLVDDKSDFEQGYLGSLDFGGELLSSGEYFFKDKLD